METQKQTARKKSSKQLNVIADKRAKYKSKLDYFLDSLMTEHFIDYTDPYTQRVMKYQKRSTKRNPYDF